MNTRRALPALLSSRRRALPPAQPAPVAEVRRIVPLPHDVAEWMGMDQAMAPIALAYGRSEQAS